MEKKTRSHRIRYVAALVVAQLAAGLVAQDTPTTVPTTAPAATGAQNGNGQNTTQPRVERALTGITKQNGNLVINFQDAAIETVLNELSSAAGFIVVLDQGVRPTGRISLVSKQPISPEEAVSLLNTVLRNNGYAAIQQDRILKVGNKDAFKRLNIPVRSGNDPAKIANTDELITQVIPLRYADATQLKNDLQPLVSTEADFTANASSNALVVTDTSANVRRLVLIVQALDTNLAGSVEVKVFQLKFANATDAAKLITDTFGDLDASRPQQNSGGDSGGGGGGGGGGFGQGGGGQGGFGFGQGGGQGGRGGNNQRRAAGNTNRLGKVSAGADQRTNSIVVTGPADLLITVAEVVKELDSNPASEETVYVYRLKNAQSANIEGVLNNLFNGTTTSRTGTATSSADTLRQFRQTSSRTSSTTGGGGGGGRTGGGGGATAGGFGGGGQNRTGGGATGGFGGFGGFGGGNTNSRVSGAAQSTASDLAGKVSIIADVDSNSLLIRTSPANYPRVKQVLDELDRAVQQVLIKVLLAEVSHNNGSDIGAELSALNLRSGATPAITNTQTVTQTNTAGTAPNTTVTQNVNSQTRTTPAGTTSLGQQGGSNFNIPVTGSGLVVQLLETNFQATIRALETTGKLDVLSRPYILASDNQLASITVGEEVPFITRTQVTDTGTLNNTIEYRDIGILLDVIPHINPDGLVIMDVAPEISTLGSEQVPISNTVFAPTIKKRSAQSRVAVKTGQTVVIGGLMEDRMTETVDKVPLLGDIPLLGELFKHTVQNKTKTELLIFLTPHVAASPDVLDEMSKDEINGTKLTPKAIGPGIYEEHQKGMRRGEIIDPNQPHLVPDEKPKPDAKSDEKPETKPE